MHIGRFEAVDFFLDYDFEKWKEKQIVFRHYFQQQQQKAREKKGLTKTRSTIFYQHDLLCHTVDTSLISAQVKFACCATDYWHQ